MIRYIVRIIEKGDRRVFLSWNIVSCYSIYYSLGVVLLVFFLYRNEVRDWVSEWMR